MPIKQKYVNDLIRYRERIGYTPQHVASLLGLRDAALLSKLEQGRRLPTFVTALRLAAIYRVPADFLYQKLYESLRDVIRRRENDMAKRHQQPLPLPYP
jgi:transcriptional regulator with XRE-family HTH domain